MDATFPNPIDGARTLGQDHAGSVPMSRRLTESEFENEVNVCLPRLVQIARRISGDDDIASDAVQQALVRASRARKKFDSRSEVSTWLTRIVIREVRRLFVDQKRRRIQTNSISSSADESGSAEPISQPHEGPAQQAMHGELNDMIRTAVNELSDRRREVFSLVTWQGMNTAAVADLLNIKEQNVYSHLHAARMQLRSRLKHYFDSGEGES